MHGDLINLASTSMFTAYYDASGKVLAGGFLSVAGLVSTEKKWSKFEARWNERLGEFDVPRFHMVEFMQSRGNFRGWAGDITKRGEFLSGLVKTIKQGVNKIFVVTLTADSVDALAAMFKFGGLKAEGAYHIAAGTCMHMIEAWVGRKYPGKHVAHVHEHGDLGQGTLPVVVSSRFQMRFVRKRDESGRDIRPFEAADLVAWEYRKHVHKLATSESVTARHSIVQIAKMLPRNLSSPVRRSPVEISEPPPV